MEGNRPYVTLKEASEQLGVHPNTLRNWERRGIIRLTRLPGSRYRRVAVSEVTRLASKMESERAEEARLHPADAGSWEVRIEHPNTDPETVAVGQVLRDEMIAKLAKVEPEETLEETMRVLRGYPDWLEWGESLDPARTRPTNVHSWGVRLEYPPPDDPVLNAKAEALLAEIKATVSKLQDETTLEEIMRSLRGRSWSS